MYNITKLPESLIKPLWLLAEQYHFSVGTKGRILEYFPCKDSILEINANEERISITAPTLPAFFRAVGTALQEERRGNQSIQSREEIWFDFNGLMLDCSRNGVVSIPYAKELILRLAMMGHTVFMLYIEDIYEVEGEPYFGYLRGKYSKQELKELDDYAFQFGIELIPCIQTLAHLDQFLAWDTARRKYMDIDNILDVGNTDVTDLLKRMLKSLSGTFRSGRIHIGMDEAYNLGRGRHADENGWHTRREIMAEHLTFMVSLCQTYKLRPIIWDDMFFHYKADTDPIRIPDGIDVMYWDYYNNTEAHYEENFDIRCKAVEHMMFAGGAWKWIGYAPHHSKTIAAANASLMVCKRKKVREVIVTSWADDGCECPISTCLLGAVLFAEHQYQKEVVPEQFQDRLKFITGIGYETFMKQEEFDILPSFQNKAVTVTPSKYMFYEDPLISLFLPHIKGIPDNLTVHYQKLSDYFAAAAFRESTPAFKASLEFYAAFGSVMSLKWNLGLNIYEAYHRNDRASLEFIIKNQLLPLFPRMEYLEETRRKEWYLTNKSYGFEVLDQRFGSVLQRLKTAKFILEQYLSGEIERIDELEETRYPVSMCREEGMGELLHYNRAVKAMSTSKMIWE